MAAIISRVRPVPGRGDGLGHSGRDAPSFQDAAGQAGLAVDWRLTPTARDPRDRVGRLVGRCLPAFAHDGHANDHGHGETDDNMRRVHGTHIC